MNYSIKVIIRLFVATLVATIVTLAKIEVGELKGNLTIFMFWTGQFSVMITVVSLFFPE